MLGADGSLVAVDPVAEGWLGLLPEGGALPVAVTAVAYQARRIATGQAEARTVARARVRTVTGRWLVLHARTFPGPDADTTVVVEPPRCTRSRP